MANLGVLHRSCSRKMETISTQEGGRCSERTNQRISFDIEPCGIHLGTEGEDGLVHIYDLQTGVWAASFQAARDTVNGFSFHPTLPLAASSSGNRRFELLDNAEKLSLSDDENCASVWSFPPADSRHDVAGEEEALAPVNIV